MLFDFWHMRQRHTGLQFYSSAKAGVASVRREMGKPGWLGLLRKVLWSWWLWICLAFLAQALGHGKLTIAVAAYGFFCYLIAPAEHIPRFGLESKFSVQS